MEKSILIRVPEELHHSVKMMAAEQRKTLKQYLIELLEEKVENEKASAKPSK